MNINHKTSVKIFTRKLDDYWTRRKRTAKERRDNLAKEWLKVLIQLSPFQTGTYIMSHRVGLNQRQTEELQIPFGTMDHMSASLASYEAGLARIGPSRLEDTIYITNTAGHALQVEWIGWLGSSPYHTYGKALAYMQAVAPSIMKGKK